MTTKEYHRKWRQENPEKARAINQRYYEKHPDRCRELSLKRKYGLTILEVNAMVEKQGGVCAICQQIPQGKKHHSQLHVDHNHITKQIRGMLCGNCNKALGLVREDPQVLEAMIKYLDQQEDLPNSTS